MLPAIVRPGTESESGQMLHEHCLSSTALIYCERSFKPRSKILQMWINVGMNLNCSEILAAVCAHAVPARFIILFH